MMPDAVTGRVQAECDAPLVVASVQTLSSTPFRPGPAIARRSDKRAIVNTTRKLPPASPLPPLRNEHRLDSGGHEPQTDAT